MTAMPEMMTEARGRSATVDPRWVAVQTSDAAFDGAFVYAVRTTGVYCRPSCRSRLPKRENVSYFVSPGRAEAAGFRACRRCKPAAATPGEVQLAQRVSDAIQRAGEAVPSLVELSRAVGVSPFHLQRTFKRVMGVTPRQFAVARRAEQLKSHLRDGADVTRALYDAGFGSSSRLYESAPELLGMTPGAYRDGGRGMTIGFTCASTSLGRMLIAATERGISSVIFGNDDAALERGLLQEYPAADIARDDAGMRDWVAAVTQLVEGQAPHRDLPTDVRASAFRMRVWQALREIPRGETRSYGEIARSIGQPTATRAVAQACKMNPTAVVVPCHRVVQGDGSLGGYRYGLDRKQALLKAEGAPPRRPTRR